MNNFEQIAYAKTVYGQDEIDAEVKCLSSSTSMEAREYFPSINQDDDNLSSYFDMDWAQWDKAREKARKHYFGKINTDASKRSALYLADILKH